MHVSPMPSRATTPTRHPLDPEPVSSTKARAVFILGIIALFTGLLVGGVVPATVAFVLARQARRDAYLAGGFLTGAAWIRRGERMAWAGLVLAATALVIAVIALLLDWAGTPVGHDFDSDVN